MRKKFLPFFTIFLLALTITLSLGNETLLAAGEKDNAQDTRTVSNLQSGWNVVSGQWYYGNNDGSAYKGWLNEYGYWYYLDPANDGVLLTDVKQNINGHTYYFASNGVMYTGWINDNGTWYYADQYGYLTSGWLYLDGYWYYLDPSNGGALLADTKEEISGYTYYFASNGVMYTGWILDNETWYYADQYGHLTSGWLYLDGYWYYLDPSNGGAVITDTKMEINGYTYYFAFNGVMYTGWINDNGTWYYADQYGYLTSGWLCLDGYWYYLDPAKDGAMIQNSMAVIGGHKYRFGQYGEMLTGWMKENGEWYYMDQNGYMVEGWLYDEGRWYYFDPANNGIMLSDIKTEIGGETYWFDIYGAACTGWINDNGDWYYAQSNGVMVYGWLNLNGTYYYLNPADGIMYKDGAYEIDGYTFRFNADGSMFTGWLAENGQWYYIDEYGYITYGWKQIEWKWYYFDENGYMVSNTVIDGWEIGPDGAMIVPELDIMSNYIQGYSSSTGYLLAVDISTRKTGIFYGSAGNWYNEYFWDCSVGAPETPTPTGVYTVGIKGYYFNSGVERCYYYTQFLGDYLFHSVPYEADGETIADDRIGQAVSHGCVRLPIDQAYWIWTNIPQGTTVVIY